MPEALMAKVFTQEEREKIKGQVVELVRRSGRETLRQLEAKTGATRYLMSVLARELVASGDVYNSGYGLFPSEQARKDWQNARKKLSRAKLKKKTPVVDLDLIWSLPDGEIRRYDRRLNIICSECRQSEVMQRVLAFYQGNYQEVML
ncbi:putative bacteriophage protein [Escherichia coli TA464]|nr:putative bacteriophage protein [Escherichia coli TA464]